MEAKREMRMRMSQPYTVVDHVMRLCPNSLTSFMTPGRE